MFAFVPCVCYVVNWFMFENFPICCVTFFSSNVMELWNCFYAFLCFFYFLHNHRLPKAIDIWKRRQVKHRFIGSIMELNLWSGFVDNTDELFDENYQIQL